MSTEMSFAQALTEARQIIVQQSNRIKSDLEKIKQLQETTAQLEAAHTKRDRAFAEQQERLAAFDEQVTTLTASLQEAEHTRANAEQIIDRQGQRISQLQDAVSTLESQRTEKAAQIDSLTAEIESVRNQLPTEEDEQALASLASLLSTKKVNVPAIGKNGPVIQMPGMPELRAA